MEASKALTIPDSTELEGKISEHVELAKAVKITTEEQYVQAGELRAGLKALDKEAEATFKPIKQGIDASKKIVLDEEKRIRNPLADAGEILNPKLIAWEDEQERLRKAKERALNELARKKAEKEAKVEAKALEKGGRNEEAAIVRETPVETTVVVPTSTPQVKGLVRRENWHYEVTNFKAVLAAVMEGQHPAAILQLNDSVVGAQVRSLKADFKCPGIRVWSEKTR